MFKSLWLFLVCLLVSFKANATIPQDEAIVRVVIYCASVFLNSQTVSYEKDKRDLERIDRGVMDELFMKYGKADSNLMIVKAMVQSSKANGDPATVCRRSFASLQNLKDKSGFYLSTN